MAPDEESQVTVHAAVASDAAALAELFEACQCPCFCRYWSFEGDKNAWLDRCANDPDSNRSELQTSLAADEPSARGLMARQNGAVIGWLKLTPALAVPKMYKQRYYQNLECFRGERAFVYVIGCILIRPDWRKRHIAEALIRAALRHAHAASAVAVEAMPRVVAAPVSDEELWLGPASTLVRLGFAQVGGDPAYPVLRHVLTQAGTT